MGTQIGTKSFIIFAAIFVILVVILIVVAVNKGTLKIEEINRAGGNIESGFFEKLFEGLSGSDADEVINNNLPDPALLIDPDGDADEDGVPNSEDIDVDGDGVYNSEEVLFACGDTNGDEVLDKTDLDAITSYAFEGVNIPTEVRADLNADGAVDVLDVVIITDNIIRGGPVPTCSSVNPLKTYQDLVCGDTNGDSILNQVDLDTITSYAFEGVEVPQGVKADLNVDNKVDVLDVVIMTDHVSRGKQTPTCSAAENKPPVIDKFDGPNIFRFIDEQSWKVKATDYEKGVISYNVEWGDGSNNNYNGGSGVEVTISHKYSQGGRYTISVKATDVQGLSSINSMIVEMPYPSIFFSDFWSNDSVGIPIGSLLYARDEQGVLSGIANNIVKDGSFLMHVYGNDPLTRDVDEGASLGSEIKFYLDGKECSLVSGSNVWADRGNKKITLSCNGAEVTEAGDKGLTSFACGDVNLDGSVNKYDVNALTDYIFGGVEIPVNVNVDINSDGVPDLLDVTTLTGHVYRGEPAPTCITTSNAKSYNAVPTTCGNINQDSVIDKLDVGMLSDYVFSGGEIPRGSNSDLNADDVSDVIDVVLLTNYVYRDGAAPTCVNLGAGA